MNALSVHRKVLIAALFTLVALVFEGCGLAPLAQASPSKAVAPSSLVSNIPPDTLLKMYGAQARSHEVSTLSDHIASPLASFRPPSSLSSLIRPNATFSSTVTSTVQTLDYTLATENGGTVDGQPFPTTAMPTNVDPVWTPDESYIVFASNRTSASNPAPSSLFHLWAVSSGGLPNSLFQLTATTTNERWPTMVSNTQIVYCATTAGSSAYSLYLASVVNNNGVIAVDTANATLLVDGSTLDCEHPSASGSFLVFAGRVNSSSPYHVYTYDVTQGLLSQLTTGPASDQNPAFSQLGSLVAWDSNATTFTTQGSGPPLLSSGTAAHRNVFVSSVSGTTVERFTNAPSGTPDSIEPAWGIVPPSTPIGGSGQIVPQGQRIWFSSNRINNHYNIYYLFAVPTGSGSPPVTDAEGQGGNTAVNVVTSDPTGLSNPPTGAFDNYEPAVPSFNFFFSIAFVTPRFLANSGTDNPIENATAPPYNNPDREAATAAPVNPGTFSPANTTLGATGGFDILSSHLEDIDPPSLLRYSSTEIVHTQNQSSLPATGGERYIPSGQTVHFVVRLSDRQTGVGQVYLQIKDPDSKYQDAAGLEHKVFSRSPSYHPGLNEATTAYGLPQLGQDGALEGEVIGGYDGTIPISLGHIVTSTPITPPVITIPNPYPANGVAGQAELSATTTAPITTLTIKDVQNIDPGEANHLAGDVLELYDNAGVPVESVQVISSTYNLTTAPPITGTFVVTPVSNIYTIPTGTMGVDDENPGYVAVIARSHMDWTGYEIDSQAIKAGTGTQVNGALSASFVIPRYLAGLDDQTPDSGDGDLADASNANGHVPTGQVWLQMTPVAPGSPLYDTNGGVLYEATWQSPNTPSDYYVDVIAYDNSVDQAQNWRIYDNVWGFTTQPFVSHTSPGGILLVNDYMLPQKFFSGRFGPLSPTNVPANYFGGESYLTDIDDNYADTTGALATLPDSGFETNAVLGQIQMTATMTQLYHRPAGGPGSAFGGITYTPYYPNGLGINSYLDPEQANVSTADAQPSFPLHNNAFNNLGESELEYNNAPQIAPSQKYDIWRVLCRGALPDPVLNAYAPAIVPQPADVIGGHPAQKVYAASSCVLWSSPFAGDEFAADGTIIDPSIQNSLSAFVNAGGRLFVEGIDVGFAITGGGAISNNFYSNILNASFLTDGVDMGDGTLVLNATEYHPNPPSPRVIYQTQYISFDAFENNEVGTRYDPNNTMTHEIVGAANNYPAVTGPIAHVNFKESTTTPPNIIPNWTYLPPAYGRLALILDERNAIGSSDTRTDGSFDDGAIFLQGIQNNGYIDGIAPTAPPAPALGPVVGLAESQDVQGSGFPTATPVPIPFPDQIMYSVFAAPSGIAQGGGITAYSSFGLESISQEVQLNTQEAPWNTGINNYPVYALQANRTDLIHNLVCFLRTGSLTGTVTNTSGGAGQPNAEVVAYPTNTGGFSTGSAFYSTTADGSGNYTIVGVPSGRYQVLAYAPGTTFQHPAGSLVDVHGGDVGHLSLQVSPAAPGSLHVTVVDALTGAKLPGATVAAVESLTGSPTYTQPSGSTGVAIFDTVAVGSYNLTVSLTNYQNGTGTATVSSAQETDVTISLNPSPGTIQGNVQSATSANLPGVTITITPTGSTGTLLTETTDSGGNYTASEAPGTYDVSASLSGYSTTTPASPGINHVTVTSNTTQTANFTMTVLPTYTVYGLISRTDASGVASAVSGATIRLVDQNHPTSVFTVASSTTFTGADGHLANWSKGSVPNGTYTASVTAPAGSGLPTLASKTVVVNGATRIDFAFTVSTVYGLISRIDTGAAVSGAKVTFTDQANSGNVRTVVTSAPFTAPDGKPANYELTTVWYSTYTVGVTATGYPPIAGKTVTVSQPALRSDQSFGLGTLFGLITRSDNAVAIAGANISLVDQLNTGNNRTTVTVPVFTGPDGKPANWELANVWYSTYSEAISASGYPTPTDQTLVMAIPSQRADARLVVNTLYGLVTRSTDNVSLAGVTVTVTSVADTAEKFTTTTTAPFTGIDGRPANWVVPTLAAGQYTIAFSNTVYKTPTILTVSLVGLDSRQDIVLTPLYFYQAGLQMISAPYDYTGIGLAGIFGYPSPVTAVYQPLISNYAITPHAPADTLHIGIGYWIRLPFATGLLVSGVKPTTATISVNLSPGWNMIGVPDTASVPINSLSFTDGAGNNLSWAQATSNQVQLINQTLYTWRPGDTAYEVNTTGGSLQPLHGYWIQAYSTATINIPTGQ